MKKNIVFVIGAGASKEVNLPTGFELKAIISDLINIRFNLRGGLFSGDANIMFALKEHAKENNEQTINSYLTEAWLIRDALPQASSIDSFIDHQKGNEKLALCGKLGIVRSILQAESDSLLYFDIHNLEKNIDFTTISDTWYTSFFQILIGSKSRNNLKERFESITLIIFNYDRCVEHFIYHALQNYYRMPSEEAAELIKSLKIYHPYGSVGRLPWMGGSDTVQFGLLPEPINLLKIAGKIKTFTEGTDPNSSEIDGIRQQIGSADKLFFLGFAFHRLNMDLLFPENYYKQRSNIKCFATAYNISNSDQMVIKDQIKEILGAKAQINMVDQKCFQFFHTFQRSLNF